MKKWVSHSKLLNSVVKCKVKTYYTHIRINLKFSHALTCIIFYFCSLGWVSSKGFSSGAMFPLLTLCVKNEIIVNDCVFKISLFKVSSLWHCGSHFVIFCLQLDEAGKAVLLWAGLMLVKVSTNSMLHVGCKQRLAMY